MTIGDEVFWNGNHRLLFWFLPTAYWSDGSLSGQEVHQKDGQMTCFFAVDAD